MRSFFLKNKLLAVYRDIGNLHFERTVVATGSFDGVHAGHRTLLRRVVDLAAQHQLRSVALTFLPHPRQVLCKESDMPKLLNIPDEKIALLEQTGVDDVVVYPFDRDLALMPASDFVRTVIIEKLNAQYLVVGQDHHFGKGRDGNIKQLAEFASHSDLQIEVVELKMHDRKISSSAIREALLCGDLTLANTMLGYAYVITGKVIAGNRLGRTIGFPTANIATPVDKLLPKDGVYRVKVKLKTNNSKLNDYIGMLYIGKRTVLKKEDATSQVEVHIFGFDGQIYGQEIELALTHRIRDDISFGNFAQLADQLQRDKEKILSTR